GTSAPSFALGPTFRCSAAHSRLLKTFQIPTIPASEILDRRYFQGEEGLAKLESGSYQGHFVIMKYRDSRVSPDDQSISAKARRALAKDKISHEAHWLQVLNRLKLGIKVFGTTEIYGHPALVIERVTEKNMTLKEPDTLEDLQYFRNLLQLRTEQGFRVTKETIQELDRALDLLAENQIMAGDLQFLLTQSGRLVLIDAELFREHKPSVDDLSPQESADEKRRNFKALLVPFIVN
ncbi:MAG: hypothetical protein ACXWC9_11585, partial [Pseudobdellovibrionaceae bacterium]